MGLDWGSEPGLQPVTVRLQGHRLEDDGGQHGVAADQSHHPRYEDETAESQSHPATVSCLSLVTTSLEEIFKSNLLFIFIAGTINKAVSIHC